MAKDYLPEFSQSWLLEEIQDTSDFACRKMFGGLACYLNEKMVLVLMEDETSTKYRGKKFPYPVWNGLLIPTSREFHDSLLKSFSSLIVHPVLQKWLYLPMTDQNYEMQAQKMIKAIQKNDPRIGVLPGNRRIQRRKLALKSHLKPRRPRDS
ncbi:MAG: hypothetical protein AB7F43_11535 [Bacteriovoracia bacterium]